MIRNRSDHKVLLLLSSAIIIATGIAMLFCGNVNITFTRKGGDNVATPSEKERPQQSRWKSSDEQAYSSYGNSKAGYYDNIPKRKLRLVAFDPNTADAATLEGLGLASWQVKSILTFRAKGGIFRKPEDFARVYQLTLGQYKQIRPYIRIARDYTPISNLVNKGEKIVEGNKDAFAFYKKIGKGEYITLNVADTATLRQVPGIGPFFAQQIKIYEERLGGYVNVDQLSEINNFPEKAKMYFQIDLSKVKKLNVNKLPFVKLRDHPYINYYQARDIVEYRQKHGSIKDIDDLKLCAHFSSEELKRVIPYLEY